MTDWPDIRSALLLRRRITVPGAGDYSLHGDGVPKKDTALVRTYLRDALRDSETVIWTTDTLLALTATSVSESLSLTVIPESVAGGMRSPFELWVANHGALVSDGPPEPVVIDALLLMRHSGEKDPLPSDDGVMVAGIIHGIPQLVFWWPVGAPLGDIVGAASDRSLSLPLMAMGHWAGMGLAARACGAVGCVEASIPEGSALVASPSKVPPGTVVN